MHAPIDWLLEGEPFIVYRARRDLLDEAEDAPRVRAARAEMLSAPAVRGLVDALAGWPGEIIASHKSAGQPFHRLTFLADLGLRAGDPGVAQITARILRHTAPEGPFQLPMPAANPRGEVESRQWGWALCDAPLIVYALARFGLGDHPAVRAAERHLTGLARENGWPCAVSKSLGSFRGPGRKEDPCPFATLAMLKALSAFADEPRLASARRAGAQSLLSLWENSASQHPYMFFMGTDFRKLKAPFVWYDLLHVLEVVSGCAELRRDPRLREMLACLKDKADGQGRFTIESAWTAWKDWEFGQKKTPSRWLTLLAWRIIRRVESPA